MSVRLLHPEIGLPHNLAHTAKKADGTNGADRTENLIFPGFQSVGKDEVTSSNLVSSSKISLKLVGFGEIFLVLITFLAG